MALNTCQGLPGLGKRRFLARKGLERWKCAFGPVGSRFSPYLTALSVLFWGGLTWVRLLGLWIGNVQTAACLFYDQRL